MIIKLSLLSLQANLYNIESQPVCSLDVDLWIARSASFQWSPPPISYAYQKPRCSQTTGLVITLKINTQYSDQAGLDEPLVSLQLIRRKMVKTAKESIRKRATSSEVYENMQEVFIEMDKSPIVSSTLLIHSH